ncbi:MAG: DUF4423 domain-containing protein [Deltaproteobacteria bacterium]|nr:MAG: DUF4423 domain-containing protein [Deltaproteobacteria bacterium]
MDFDALTTEICRTLRGPRSQIQLARRLGYRSNVPATWESGRAAPPATTWFAACLRLGVPVRERLAAFLATAPPWLRQLDEPAGIAALVSTLKGRASAVELAERTGLSRHAIGRFARGEAVPRLPDLLRLVHHTSDRLLDFTAVFVDPSEVPSLADGWARLVEGRRLCIDQPWVQPVLLALELAAYKALPQHSHAWLANRLGMPEERVRDAIAALARTGQVLWDGHHWRWHQVLAVDTRRGSPGVVAMRAWFAEQSLTRLRADQEDALFSQTLCTISEADLARLRELHVSQFRELQALIAQSEPGERVVLLQRSVVPLDLGPLDVIESS